MKIYWSLLVKLLLILLFEFSIIIFPAYFALYSAINMIFVPIIYFSYINEKQA